MTIQGLNYERLLQISKRVNWRLEDIIGRDKPMDFTKPFLPESFARTAMLDFLSPAERLKLNHIRAYEYLSMFELVERCILPMVEDLTQSSTGQDPHRGPALAQFTAEEEKHIELFVRFRRAFAEGFNVDCGFIGPMEEIRAAVLNHGRLGKAMFVLGIELATQRHYLDSVERDEGLDTQFKNLLKHHWMEECQHAKLDAMLFFELAAKATPAEIDQAFDDFLDIGGFLDGGFAQQTALDLAALEAAIGRTLSDSERQRFTEVQHQAMRWTFLGSALKNEAFLDALEQISPAGRLRIEQVAPAFC